MIVSSQSQVKIVLVVLGFNHITATPGRSGCIAWLSHGPPTFQNPVGKLGLHAVPVTGTAVVRRVYNGYGPSRDGPSFEFPNSLRDGTRNGTPVTAVATASLS
ncbi:hypothetical protein C8R45DRAFT_1098019 [Mycena sanguinolenta]|nr:hypothetical protein C8R45DRAFT_1098019 [Mycena sanguinolenta]